MISPSGRIDLDEWPSGCRSGLHKEVGVGDELETEARPAMCEMSLEGFHGPHDIPDGYSEALHRSLASTIAEPGSLVGSGRAMACHEHTPGEEAHCVGWLMNQIGAGNNIPLRLQVRSCENIDAVCSPGAAA